MQQASATYGGVPRAANRRACGCGGVTLQGALDMGTRARPAATDPYRGFDVYCSRARGGGCDGAGVLALWSSAGVACYGWASCALCSAVRPSPRGRVCFDLLCGARGLTSVLRAPTACNARFFARLGVVLVLSMHTNRLHRPTRCNELKSIGLSTNDRQRGGPEPPNAAAAGRTPLYIRCKTPSSGQAPRSGAGAPPHHPRRATRKTTGLSPP